MSATDSLGPRIAVDVRGRTRLGFLTNEPSGGIATVVFLGPRGQVTRDIPEDKILGVVGKTFWSSQPVSPQVSKRTGIPEVCDRVAFFDSDSGRQRKGWVWEIEDHGNGVVILLVESIVHLPEGKTECDALPDEITVEHFFERRWPEEIVLLPSGEGYRDLMWSEVRDIESMLLQGLNMPVERRVYHEMKGGQPQSAGKAQPRDEVTRGAEKVRELSARMAAIRKALL